MLYVDSCIVVQLLADTEEASADVSTKIVLLGEPLVNACPITNQSACPQEILVQVHLAPKVVNPSITSIDKSSFCANNSLFNEAESHCGAEGLSTS